MNFKLIDSVQNSGRTKEEKNKDSGLIVEVPIFEASVTEQRKYDVTVQDLEIRVNEIDTRIAYFQGKIDSLNLEKTKITNVLASIK